MKILLLEDDFTLSKEISKFLVSKGFVCEPVFDGDMFLQQHKLETYDLYLLDINVPGMTGLKLCEAIREEDKNIPILMLTAYGQVEDKVIAFNAGADDYLVKPFHFDELLVRIEALLRRKNSTPKAPIAIIIEDLEIYENELRVMRGGQEIMLSPKEYQLLLLLAQANGRIVSKQTISEKIWDYNVDVGLNAIEVYINFLRKKVDRDFKTKLIHTRTGFGYYLKAESK